MTEQMIYLDLIASVLKFGVSIILLICLWLVMRIFTKFRIMHQDMMNVLHALRDVISILSGFPVNNGDSLKKHGERFGRMTSYPPVPSEVEIVDSGDKPHWNPKERKSDEGA